MVFMRFIVHRIFWLDRQPSSLWGRDKLIRANVADLVGRLVAHTGDINPGLAALVGIEQIIGEARPVEVAKTACRVRGIDGGAVARESVGRSLLAGTHRQREQLR